MPYEHEQTVAHGLSITVAPSSQRCYLLELPAEIRVMIYELSFDRSRTGSTSEDDFVKPTMLEVAKEHISNSAILRTSNQLWREAAPIYQNIIQAEVKSMKNARKNERSYHRSRRGSESFGQRTINNFFSRVRKFDKAIERLEESLEFLKEFEAIGASATLTEASSGSGNMM